MDKAGRIILGVYAGIGALVLLLLTFLAIKKYNDSKKEDFEKRDN